MISFEVAKKAKKAGKDEKVVDVPIEDKVYKARRPTVAQGILMAEAASGDASLGAVFKLIGSLLGEEAREHVERLVWERKIDMGDLLGGGTDLNPEHGLVDAIFAEFAKDAVKARPTKPSSGSSSSRGTGGRRSTGRSPGKGSIHTASPSTASSTTSTSGSASDSTPTN